jgi:signal peptide peptidase SppA
MNKLFLSRLASDVPLMHAETLAALLGQTITPGDVQLAEHPAMKNLREACRTKIEMAGDNIAIIPVQGTLAHKPDPIETAFYNVEDSGHVRGMIESAASNPAVKGILLRMDAPGGMMLGGPEIADAVLSARKAGKPVVAHIGGLGASLGYMIASQANAVIANRSAIVGSIGVIASITDYSKLLENAGIKIETFTNKEAKFKATGALGTSLTADQREYLQAQVDGAFGVFRAAVLTARPQVKREAMEGKVYRGSEAVKLGLLDATGSEGDALAVLRKLIGNPQAVAFQQQPTTVSASSPQTATEMALAAKGVRTLSELPTARKHSLRLTGLAA